MTSDPKPAPILILGLGNPLLQDDGLGLTILETLAARAGAWGDRVELMDGGTQGMALLGRLEGREALVILDAVALGVRPGTLHSLEDEKLYENLPCAASTSHEGNAGDLLRAAALTGVIPDKIAVVGIEPGQVRTGIGLSHEVEKTIGEAADAAASVVERFLEKASNPLEA